MAVNRTLDAEAARAITEIFTEVIIAPDATDEAIAIVGAKKNLRLLLAGGLPDPRAGGLMLKSVAGGLLVQSRDNAVVDDMTLDVVTKRAPTNAELRDLAFAFRVAKHVKSNTIVYARDCATVGIGAGQMSRIDAARIAARKAEDAAGATGAKEFTKGSVVASDALPVRGRPVGRDRGGRDRSDPTRRLDARRRGTAPGRRARHRDGVHRHAALPALECLLAHGVFAGIRLFATLVRRVGLSSAPPASSCARWEGEPEPPCSYNDYNDAPHEPRRYVERVSKSRT